jgi:hypothetical protein
MVSNMSVVMVVVRLLARVVVAAVVVSTEVAAGGLCLSVRQVVAVAPL